MRTQARRRTLPGLAERLLHPEPRSVDAAQSAAVMADGERGGRVRAVQRLQATAGNAAVSELVAQRLASPSPGRPLDGSTRHRLEAGLGADLASVRVHDDAEASVLSRMLGAHAFTSGADIFLSRSAHGDVHTLAHEAAHVVQQSAGPVDGTDAGAGVAVSDPGDRFERAAEHAADDVVGGRPAAAGPEISGPAGSGSTSVQRTDPWEQDYDTPSPEDMEQLNQMSEQGEFGEGLENPIENTPETPMETPAEPTEYPFENDFPERLEGEGTDSMDPDPEGLLEGEGETATEAATETATETAGETALETAGDTALEEGAGEVAGEGLLGAAAPVAVPLAAGAAAFLVGEDSAVPQDEEMAMLAESKRQQAAREAAAAGQ